MLKLCLHINELTLAEAFEELFAQAGICIRNDEEECEGLLFTPPHSEGSLPSLNFVRFTQPIRFIDLLSHLENLPYRQEIAFSHFTLDVREKLLKNVKTNEIQRLTGKESELLRFFHQHKGRELSKEKLLQEIWAYHPEAETHTLETHIYRLRQKLEEDPNTPHILLNGKDGYWLK